MLVGSSASETTTTTSIGCGSGISAAIGSGIGSGSAITTTGADNTVSTITSPVLKLLSGVGVSTTGSTYPIH